MRFLRRAGCETEKGKRKGKGSHFSVTRGDCHTIVSDHPGEVPTGTLNSILKALGLEDEFKNRGRKGRRR